MLFTRYSSDVRSELVCMQNDTELKYGRLLSQRSFQYINPNWTLNKGKLPESSGQMNTKQKKRLENYENGNFAGISRFAENGAICRQQCSALRFTHTHTHTNPLTQQFCDRFSDRKWMITSNRRTKWIQPVKCTSCSVAFTVFSMSNGLIIAFAWFNFHPLHRHTWTWNILSRTKPFTDRR